MFQPEFQPQDVERALTLERETERDGWTIASQNGMAEYSYRVTDAKPSLQTRGKLHLDKVSLETALRMLTTPSIRNEWDSEFLKMQVLEQNGDCKTIYWQIRFPRCFKDRDMIQFSFVRYVKDQDAYVILYKEGNHPTRPPTGQYVRMTTGFSCTVLRRDEKDPTRSSTLFVLASVSYGGFIGWLMPNFFRARMYASSLEGLRRRMVREGDKYADSVVASPDMSPGNTSPAPTATQAAAPSTPVDCQCAMNGIRFRAV